MERSLEIVFMGSEARPYHHRSEVGAFADALGRELERRGHLVVTILPDGPYLDRFPGLHFEEPIALSVGGREASARIATVEGRRGRILAIGGGPLTGLELGQVAASAEAAEHFARATLAALRDLRWSPHVFHLLDPSAALVPVLVREDRTLPSQIRDARTLYSILDLASAPLFPSEARAGMGELGEIPAVRRSLDLNGGTSFLRAGLYYADRVTAPGTAFADELQREGGGYGFEDVLAQKADRFEGIPLGIDTSRWNPLSDELLPYRYSAHDLVQRGNDKVRLLESLGLPVEPDVPLIAVDAELADGQGWDLLEAVAGDLLGERLKLALFGRRVGGVVSRWEQWAEGLASTAPDRVAFVRDASEPQFRLELAGSDFLLLAPRREPTGQLAMRAMHYGCVPIAYSTGALADVVRPYLLDIARGEGFVFDRYDGGALLAAVRRAIEIYPKRSAWKRLVAHLQLIEVSWSRTANRYVAAYERVLVMPPAQ